jgi:amidohydrolase
MTTIDDLAREVSGLKESTVALRRELHQIPELAFEETLTAELIASRLRALGLEVQQGIGGTGVLGWLEGTKPGKTLMLRADMDALPIQEPQDRPYKSLTENRSHACGHDFNMTLVLSSAQVLAARRDSITGRVAFVFQPADEPQLGAQRMIDDGLLDKVKPDMVIAQHAMDNIPTGKVVAQAGRLWASTNTMKLVIQGERGASNSPHTGVDSTLIAAEVITTLYAMMHRVSPTRDEVFFRVNSIQAQGGFQGPRAEVGMRLGTFNKATQETLRQRIQELVTGMVTAMGGTCTLEDTLTIPPVVNDPTVAQAVINATAQVVGQENIVREWRNLFSDDIAVFMESTPGCVFAMGTYNPDKGTGGFHRPDYDVDEDALPLGVEIMSRAALELLR